MQVNEDTYTGPSFSLKNRVARLTWNVVYIIFFRISPRPLHAWRSFLLRLFGAQIGRSVHVYPAVRIWAPWNLQIKDEGGVGNGAIIYTQGKITIGKRAIISQGVHLCAGTHDYTKKGHPLLTAPITVEDNVWLAADVFVHPGVTIGEGAVIGARSVVVKDMPAWTVCAGHPCKPIKPRVIEG